MLLNIKALSDIISEASIAKYYAYRKDAVAKKMQRHSFFMMREQKMSIIETYRNSITRKRETITKLLNDKAKESTKVANASKKIDSARSAINRTSNQTTIKNRLRDIERAEKDKSESYKKIALIDGKISKLEKEIVNDEKRMSQEQVREQKKQYRKDADLQRMTQRQIDSVNRTLQLHEDIQSDMQDQIEVLSRLPKKITVLFLAANPKHTDSLRLDEEAREIQERIRRSEYRDTITFVSRWAVRTGDIIEAINEVKPDIIHFSGHGNEDGDLVFENEYGEPKLVKKEAMTSAISTVSDRVRFMFFNACFSAEQAESIVEHIDAAIGMTDSIGDLAAVAFASQFYSSVGYGNSVRIAFEQAKANLMLEGIDEENTPDLYVKHGLSADDIYLVRPEGIESFEEDRVNVEELLR